MKQQIVNYKIEMFGKEEEPVYLSQEEGQKLIIALSLKDCPKFVFISGEMLNVSSIKRVSKYQIPRADDQFRELTESEAEVQKRFDIFRGGKNLLLQ